MTSYIYQHLVTLCCAGVVAFSSMAVTSADAADNYGVADTEHQTEVSPDLLAAEEIDRFTGNPRVIVLSDMGNEPDDQMSFIRFLLYANEMDIEGLVAVTSFFQKDVTHPDTLRALLSVYGDVQPNLSKHADGWPEAKDLLSRVSSGPVGYGIDAIDIEKLSSGAQSIIAAADKEDTRPLWIDVWGGANTLAEALSWVRANRSQEALASFVEKLRVYSISDQDDSGPWVRREFPDLHYIVYPTIPGGDEFYYATWTGIAGDEYYRNGAGADTSLITNEWLDKHIRSKGELGKHYPKYWFIMEGDTPAFLHLIRNGLHSYRNAGWGGWGGRYIFRQPYGETHPIWTQGGDLFRRVTSQDSVLGVDGREYISDQATIWRWREAFQNDFAARMDWTFQPFDKANHPPDVMVNNLANDQPLEMSVHVGETLTIDASATHDRDGDDLAYRWFQYEEAGYSPDWGVADIHMENVDQPQVRVKINASCKDYWLPKLMACPQQGRAHLVLAVTDDGEPQLTRYQRVILTVTDPELAE